MNALILQMLVHGDGKNLSTRLTCLVPHEFFRIREVRRPRFPSLWPMSCFTPPQIWIYIYIQYVLQIIYIYKLIFFIQILIITIFYIFYYYLLKHFFLLPFRTFTTSNTFSFISTSLMFHYEWQYLQFSPLLSRIDFLCLK